MNGNFIRVRRVSTEAEVVDRYREAQALRLLRYCREHDVDYSTASGEDIARIGAVLSGTDGKIVPEAQDLAEVGLEAVES